MKAILFDLDGVFYESDRPVPGAADVISWVRQRDIPHLFLTNTTSRDRASWPKARRLRHLYKQGTNTHAAGCGGVLVETVRSK